jgi:hypothetical protein
MESWIVLGVLLVDSFWNARKSDEEAFGRSCLFRRSPGLACSLSSPPQGKRRSSRFFSSECIPSDPCNTVLLSQNQIDLLASYYLQRHEIDLLASSCL